MLRFPVLTFLLSTTLCAQTAPLLRAHVEFLASDSMAGRKCPSSSCVITADYILAQFRSMGLDVQIQETTPIFEVRRGKVIVQPPGAPPEWIAMDSAAKVGPDQSLLTRSGKIPASVELNPVLSGTGNITVRAVPGGLRNVIGVLRGSNRALRDTYVLVTAHYDHLGSGDTEKDRDIRNGANDNASGVAGMLEIARSMASAKFKPARTVVFIGFFGEESGMVGSRYYALNPVFPVDKTFAQVNLEQLGRTDDSEGPRVKAATVTGWDRSKVGATLAASAAPLGVRIYKHEKFSEAYFNASDNEALAKLGVPAHTVSVAYGFPDYHAANDDSDKLDYDNMALVVRALRTGVTALANRRTAITGPPAPAGAKTTGKSKPTTPAQSKPATKP